MLLLVFAASCAAATADCRRYIYGFCASSTCFATSWCRCTLSTRNDHLPAIGRCHWISAASTFQHAWAVLPLASLYFICRSTKTSSFMHARACELLAATIKALESSFPFLVSHVAATCQAR